eukprot:TRINITY_DN6263_c0_g1_i6.p3 TRINITY_DN6263_c0_g1~~TRINITY_DN6263_c0_g1_i6.p3  ORF type:complete len:152 (-),score=8.12 TRINITY_DN6263_c0_g1_i6:32-487(-)
MEAKWQLGTHIVIVCGCGMQITLNSLINQLPRKKEEFISCGFVSCLREYESCTKVVACTDTGTVYSWKLGMYENRTRAILPCREESILNILKQNKEFEVPDGTENLAMISSCNPQGNKTAVGICIKQGNIKREYIVVFDNIAEEQYLQKLN